MTESDLLADRVDAALGDGLAAGELPCAPDGGMVTGWLLVGQYADADGAGGWFVREAGGQTVTLSAGLLRLAQEVIEAGLRAEVLDDD